MLKPTAHVFVLISILIALTLGSAIAIGQEADSQIRFIHGITDGPDVNIAIDGQVASLDLAPGSTTSYIRVPAGEHTISAIDSDTGTLLWSQSVQLSAGTEYSLVAVADGPSFFIISEDRSQIAAGSARLLVLHAAPGLGTVDITTGDGTGLATGLAPMNTLGTFDLPADGYQFLVTPQSSGTTVPVEANLTAGAFSLLVVTDSSSGPALIQAESAIPGDGNLVRFVNAAPGTTPAIFVDDALAVPALAFQSVTPFLSVTGDTVTFRVGSTEASVEIPSGQSGTTVVLMGTDSLQAIAYPTPLDANGIGSDMVLTSGINAIPGSSALSITLETDDASVNTPLIFNKAYGDGGDEAVFSPVSAGMVMAFTMDGRFGQVTVPAQAFYGGTFNTIVAVPGTAFSGPSVLVAPVSISRGITSAPSNVIASLPVEQLPPPAPTVAPTVSTSEVVISPAVPTATPFDGYTARVNLDPGANLQLRMLPSAEALSLGLAPSGIELVVNGREGAPVYAESAAPATEEPWEDPALGLDPEDPQADLDPAQTWLNVTMATSDGGSITAWVNALYVQMNPYRNRALKLAELPLVPGNQIGEAANTAVTPPPVLRDRVEVVVFNLDPGVNLNVRRLPDTTGEVLAGLPNGTVSTFVGLLLAPEGEPQPLDEENPWVFIEYQAPEGGVVTGWVSTLYVQYLWNGNPISLENLRQRELMPDYVPADRIGEISAGLTIGAPVPTVNPLRDVFVAEVILDPGANLHLRRQPDSASESIALIPANTQLVVDGRTEDGIWLRATFEGLQGFIASQFTVITFNGNLADASDVPVIPAEVTEDAS
jgi:uncharacterized protein YraI